MAHSTGPSENDVTAGSARDAITASPALRKSRASAALRLYEQECALDDARGSGVTAWIVRAEQALHAAIVDYESIDAAA